MNSSSGHSQQRTKYLATPPSPSSAASEITLGVWRAVVFAPDQPLGGPTFFPRQIHGGTIVRVEDLTRQELEADGLIVTAPGIRGGITTADCAPLIITSDTVALNLHMSRMSLVRGLLDNVLTYLAPADITHVFIGPHVCEYHLSFEEEKFLLRQFRYRFPKAVHFHHGKVYLSLRQAILKTFEEWDLPLGRVVEDGRCTFEHEELPSYRRMVLRDKQEKAPGLRTVVWR